MTDCGYTQGEIDMLEKAWALRQTGCRSMREIAEQLGVRRLVLIEALEEWLERGRPGATR